MEQLVSPGHGPELITDAKFEDFKLHAEFNCAPGSNSGGYLRSRSTNSSGRVAGTAAQAGRMADYDITLAGRVVTVVQNGRTIIDKRGLPASQAEPWIVTKHCPDRSICR